MKIGVVREHTDWRNARRNVSWIYTGFSIVGSTPTTVVIECIRGIFIWPHRLVWQGFWLLKSGNSVRCRVGLPFIKLASYLLLYEEIKTKAIHQKNYSGDYI